MRSLLVALVTTALLSTPAIAGNKDKLTQIERQQAAAKKVSDTLSKEVGELAAEQADLKKQLVRLASELQAQEKRLMTTRASEAEAEQQMQAAHAQLNERRHELEAMVQAAVRMSQVPPQAMLMMPEISEDSMHLTRSLSIMADTLKRRAETLREQIATLKSTHARVKKLRKQTEGQLARVDQQRLDLAEKVRMRSKLAAKLNEQLGTERSRLSDLSKQARDLRQLISAIEKNTQRQAQKAQKAQQAQKKIKASTNATPEKSAYVEAAASASGTRGTLRSFSQAKGKLRAPSAGKIVGHWQSNAANELSKGMTIETAQSASVKATYDGQVAFVGKFRRYGNMVILKHSGDYYSLIAGLSEINTSEGETLLEGEPIGSMGSDTKKLYVELRKGGDPFNPKGWFRGL